MSTISMSRDGFQIGVMGSEVPAPGGFEMPGHFMLSWPNDGGPRLHPTTNVMQLATVHPFFSNLGETELAAGLRSGDVLLTVNGHDTREYLNPFRDWRPGARYILRIQRNGELRDITLEMNRGTR